MPIFCTTQQFSRNEHAMHVNPRPVLPTLILFVILKGIMLNFKIFIYF